MDYHCHEVNDDVRQTFQSALEAIQNCIRDESNRPRRSEPSAPFVPPPQRSHLHTPLQNIVKESRLDRTWADGEQLEGPLELPNDFDAPKKVDRSTLAGIAIAGSSVLSGTTLDSAQPTVLSNGQGQSTLV